MGVYSVSEDRSVERLSVAKAAQALGVTRDAIHKRIRRDSIEHEQDEDGRFYVFVDTSATDAERSTDVSIDDRTDILIAEMRDRIRSLEEANRENRRIIAALTQRIPAIEAPSESSEGPETASPQPGREPQPPLEGAQEPRESHEMAMLEEVGGGPLPHDQQTPSERPWWRRMFGR